MAAWAHAKRGKADICVLDRTGRTLLIIECKTAGAEYQEASKTLDADGGQLFSYWQQDQNVRWLMLYASDYDEGSEEVRRYGRVIHCVDTIDKEREAIGLRPDETLSIYATSATAAAKHQAWVDSYNRATEDVSIVFGAAAPAYSLGTTLTASALVKFGIDDPKFVSGQFEEILRHNNISDKENSFNRLVALLICKLADETKKRDEDVLDFQVKPSDTIEDLQDRLQKLYHEGMHDFMGEDVYYVPQDFPEEVIKQCSGQHRKKLIEELSLTIRKLKFYTNNEFAFKEVYNETLFRQNGRVLIEIVHLIQRFKFIDSLSKQFLGDLFEDLLDSGFKQDEGQYFTPRPITQFVWDALPVARIIEQGEMKPPRIIDYACGAGHFLIEGVDAVNDYFFNREDPLPDNRWCADSVVGIEKDYRLARASKVSMYMNGAGDSQIVFGDGLADHPEHGVEKGAFDILVANPPYSVSGFKAHLPQRVVSDYAVSNYITDKGGQIELMFMERVGKLLKPRGVAAVILPASVFSNEHLSFQRARETLLKDCRLVSVALLADRTFQATGTNTVLCFLEKRDEPPVYKNVLEDSVSAIFDMRKDEGWEGEDIFQEYLMKVGISESDYLSFLAGRRGWSKLGAFSRYRDEWRESPVRKALTSRKSFQGLPEGEQEAALEGGMRDQLLSVERRKLYVFALTRGQRVFVVSAPRGAKEQTRFLGYKWSRSRAHKGILTVKEGGENLFDPDDREAPGTLACGVRDAYRGSFEEDFEHSHSIDLADAIEFDTPRFDLVMRFDKPAPKTLWRCDCLRLDAISRKIVIGKTPPSDNPAYYYSGEHPWANIADLDGGVISETKNTITDLAVSDCSMRPVNKNSIMISFKLSIGKTAIAGCDMYTNEAIAALDDIDRNLVSPAYLFEVLSSGAVPMVPRGMKKFGATLNEESLKGLMIPVPSLDDQLSIISNLEAIDKRREELRQNKREAESVLQGSAAELLSAARSAPLSRYAKDASRAVSPDKLDGMVEYVQLENIEPHTGRLVGETLTDAALIGSNKHVFESGDVLYSKLRAYLNKVWLADRGGVCSQEFIVLRFDDERRARTLSWLMRQPEFLEKVIAINPKGQGRPRLNTKQLMKLEIPDVSRKNWIKFSSLLVSFDREAAEYGRQLQICDAERSTVFKTMLTQ